MELPDELYGVVTINKSNFVEVRMIHPTKNGALGEKEEIERLDTRNTLREVGIYRMLKVT